MRCCRFTLLLLQALAVDQRECVTESGVARPCLTTGVLRGALRMILVVGCLGALGTCGQPGGAPATTVGLVLVELLLLLALAEDC